MICDVLSDEKNHHLIEEVLLTFNTTYQATPSHPSMQESQCGVEESKSTEHIEASAVEPVLEKKPLCKMTADELQSHKKAILNIYASFIFCRYISGASDLTNSKNIIHTLVQRARNNPDRNSASHKTLAVIGLLPLLEKKTNPIVYQHIDCSRLDFE